MSSNISFGSDKKPLRELISAIRDGKIQLPDFQRGWVWDDERIQGLLTSISLGYPVGSVMLLQTGNPDVKLKPRLIEGAKPPKNIEPDQLILDGQQRLTALTIVFDQENPVNTLDFRKKPIKRWYYIDIKKSLNPRIDREDAIISLPENKLIKNFRGETEQDFSTPEKEYEAGLFPVAYTLNFPEWRRGYNAYWKHDPEKTKQIDNFEEEIIYQFLQYLLPVILIGKDSPKDAICQIFERVNTSGVILTSFELLTATYAMDDFRLRDDWKEINAKFKEDKKLNKIENTDFLQAVSLLSTFERKQEKISKGLPEDEIPAISCKRKDILKLELENYKKWSKIARDGFVKSGRLLAQQSIFNEGNLPYRTQLIPLASVLGVLGDDADKDGVRSKIFRWYWCGILGELYGSATETRFAKDFPELLQWINGGGEPTTIQDAHFSPPRLESLRTKNSAAYKGISILLMRDGGLDFRSGNPITFSLYDEEQIDIHHIFPEEWCKEHQIPANLYNSIINKTPISAKTNKIIGKNAPTKYLEKLEKIAGIDKNRMDEILRSHVIDPKFLRTDDFNGFFAARKEAILSRIEGAMGKPIARDAIEYIENGAE